MIVQACIKKGYQYGSGEKKCNKKDAYLAAFLPGSSLYKCLKFLVSNVGLLALVVNG
jgi:hypothetical protein